MSAVIISKNKNLKGIYYENLFKNSSPHETWQNVYNILGCKKDINKIKFNDEEIIEKHIISIEMFVFGLRIEIFGGKLNKFIWANPKTNILI